MSPPERIDALMAGDPPEADEQRLARVIYELQAARPAAPEPLRSRIEALASAESARRPSLLERLTLRRALLVLAPAVVVVSVGAAVVQGIVSASSPAEEAQPPTQPTVSAQMRESPQAGAAAETDSNQGARSLAPVTQTANRAFPRTSPGRAQDYYADLRLRVDDLDSLSDRMQEALRLTRRYGGYVVSTSYRNPRAGEGDATLELRVPIGRVQQALVAFSELGAILSQNVSIRDLQGQIDRYTRDIRRLRDRMAALRASLLDPNLTAVERSRIERQLAQARSRLGALEQERRALARQGRFAKISLALTTQEAAAKEETPGRIERALDDAGSVLAKEVAFGLYALIVASPFLLLTALAIAGARIGRRRADQRLLERA
jgi:negative regulator of sigma E activity